MNHNPKFSIITVTYNAAAVVEPTLRSIISQSYNNYEFILVDGGSSDDTVSKVRESGVKASHIVSERDKGLYDAMNKGIRLATGDYLCFLNAGDSFPMFFMVRQPLSMISVNLCVCAACRLPSSCIGQASSRGC